MDSHEHHADPVADATRTSSEVNLKLVIWFGVGLFLTTVISFVFVAGLFTAYHTREADLKKSLYPREMSRGSEPLQYRRGDLEATIPGRTEESWRDEESGRAKVGAGVGSTEGLEVSDERDLTRSSVVERKVGDKTEQRVVEPIDKAMRRVLDNKTLKFRGENSSKLTNVPSDASSGRK